MKESFTTKIVYIDTKEQTIKGTLRGLIALVVLVVANIIWYALSDKFLYKPILTTIQKGSLPYRLQYSLIAWILLCSAIAVQQPTTDGEALSYGALVGLVVYGVYNSTNMTIFQGWKAKLSLIDTSWGIINCMFSAWVTFRLSEIWELYPSKRASASF